MVAEMQDKDFLEFVKESQLMNRLSSIRTSGLELEAPGGAKLTAGTPAQHC